jgi:hypothetical protein
MAKGRKQSRCRTNKATSHSADNQNGHHGGTKPKSLITTGNLALVCAALSLMLYWNTHSGSWVFDDHVAIVENPDATGMAPLSRLFRNDFWGQPLASNGSHKSFRPLTVLSFRINHLLSGGLYTRSFHICNNILNAISVFAAVWTISAVLGANQVKGYTLIVASFVYTFHPIHVEAVANTVGRAELLGAGLEFLSFYLHFCSMKDEERRAKTYFSASVILAFCAALAKEPCLMVLAICGANEIATIWIPRKESLTDSRRFHQSIVRFVLLALTGVAYVWIRLIINGDSVGIKPAFKDNPLMFANSKASFVLTALHIQAVYIWKLIYSFNFCCDYGFNTIPMIESLNDVRNLETLVWAVGLLFLITQGLRNAREERDPRLLMGLAWILAPLLPASHIIPLGTVLAERLLYVPSLGYSILIGLGVEQLFTEKYKLKLNVAGPIFVVILSVYANTIIQRNQDWKSNETLWAADHASHPQNVKMATTHAKAVLRTTGNHEMAWHITSKAYEILPTDMPNLVIYAKATAFSKAGGRNLTKAHELLDGGIELLEERNHFKSRDFDVYSTKASLLTREKRYKEAKPLMVKAAEIASRTDSGDPKPHCNLGEIEALMGEWTNSVGFLEKCVSLSTPEEGLKDGGEHRKRLVNLGNSYYMTKQLDQAEEVFLESQKFVEDPNVQLLLDDIVKRKKKQENQATETQS